MTLLCHYLHVCEIGNFLWRISSVTGLLHNRIMAHNKQEYLSLKTGLLCRGSGSQHIAMLPVQVKVWKLIQPISEPDLPYMIILLADWRCWHYELKRENDTDLLCSHSPNDVPPQPLPTSAESIHSRCTGRHASVQKNDTEIVNPPFIVPSLSLKVTFCSDLFYDLTKFH